jgi:hypothetical protein
VSRAFPAQYPGRCAECGQPFEAGTPIRATHHNVRAYEHAVCPPEVDDTPAPTKFEGTTDEEMGF